MKRIRAIAVAFLVALLWFPASVAAQLNSSEATATLTAVLPESLTVTLLPAAVTFTLTSGSASNAGNIAITATTSWTLAVTRTNIALLRLFLERIRRSGAHGGHQHH